MKRIDPIAWALIAPAQLLLIGVIAIPALFVAWLSLTQSSYGVAPSWVGFANYRAILTDPYFWRALWNTLVLVNIVVYVELAMALGVALLFAGGVPARRAMVAIVLAPYAVSEVVAVLVWRTLMDPDIGPLAHGLAALGLPLDWTVSAPAALALIGVINIWMHLPFSFVLLYTALLAIPVDLYEAARIDGAGAWSEFWNITRPMLAPAMLVTLLFRYVFAFRLFSEAWLLTQGGPARGTEVVAEYLYLEGFRYGDFGAASATGWLMMIVSLLLALPYLRRMYRQMAG